MIFFKGARLFKRVETPVYLQMEAAECGAACLGIILGYYHHFRSLDELRISCAISRDGTTAGHLIKAAQHYQLEAAAYKKESLEQLYELQLPLIAFWEFKHFLVIEGFDRKWVYLNDPATGPRRIDHDSFSASFTGIVLTFTPSKTFRTFGKPHNNMNALFQRLKKIKAGLWFTVGIGVLMIIPGLVVPILSKVFVDTILVNNQVSWLGPLVIGILITLVIQALLSGLQKHMLQRMDLYLSIQTTSQFFWRILRLPMSFFSHRFSGELASRVFLNDRISQALTGQLAISILGFISILFFGAVMAHYDLVLTAISFGIIGINALLIRNLGSRSQKNAILALSKEQAQLTTLSLNGISSIETLKATGRENDFIERWTGQQTLVLNAYQKLVSLNEIQSALPIFLSACNTAAILTMGTLRIIEGSLSIGSLIAFLNLSMSVMKPVQDVINLSSTIQQLEGDFSRVDDVLQYAVTPSHPVTSEMSPKKLTGKLELRDVSFGYNPAAPALLQNVSLSLTPGQRVALVGGSGSGKSTLIRLICGLQDAWSGAILFDGKLRTELPKSVLSQSIALVDQEVVLFEGTLKDNLTLWDEAVDETHWMQAAKDASLHGDINQRPAAYDSWVEEGGRNFSGGQRQRIEIARALTQNPSILILDEATSALDPILELEIDTAIQNRTCSCLIVSHRLSTIRNCDEIIVLEKGHVIERGTHEELVALNGHYVTLINH